MDFNGFKWIWMNSNGWSWMKIDRAWWKFHGESETPCWVCGGPCSNLFFKGGIYRSRRRPSNGWGSTVLHPGCTSTALNGSTAQPFDVEGGRHEKRACHEQLGTTDRDTPKKSQRCGSGTAKPTFIVLMARQQEEVPHLFWHATWATAVLPSLSLAATSFEVGQWENPITNADQCGECRYLTWLVGGLVAIFYFPIYIHILGIIIPID